MNTFQVVVSGAAPLALLAQSLLLFWESQPARAAAPPDAPFVAPWLDAAIAPGTSAAVRVEARSPEEYRLLFAAALALSLACLMGLEAYGEATHAIITAPALGLLMWEGEVAWIARAVLLLFALTLSLVTPSLHVTGATTEPHPRRKPPTEAEYAGLIGPPLVLAVLGQVAEVFALGKAGAAEAQVYALSLYAPSVLLLLLSSLVQCLLVRSKHGYLRRLAITAAVCFGFSLLALAASSAAGDTLVGLVLRASEVPSLSLHWGIAAGITGAGALLLHLGDRGQHSAPMAREVDGAFVASVACIALAHLDLAYLGWLPDWVDVALSGWAAAAWVELNSKPLSTARDGLRGVFERGSVFRKALDRGYGRLNAAWRKVLAMLRGTSDVTKPYPRPVRLVMLYLFISLVYLGAMYPSRGRLIVNVFVSGEEGGRPMLGIEAAEKVRERMADFVNQLCVETKAWYVPGKEDPDDPRGRCRLPAVLHEQEQAGVVKDLLQFGVFNIPVELVQGAFAWTKWLLWERELSGAVVLTDGTYHLFVHAKTSGPLGQVEAISASGKDLDATAGEIAFHVLRDEAGWRDTGLTRDYDAFAPFTAGIRLLRDHARGDHADPALLKGATEQLSLAVERDGSFAAARYFLAQALIREEQFDSALHELQLAEQSPGFRDTASDAIAKLHWQVPAYTRTGIVPQRLWERGTGAEARVEARRRWERVRASASSDSPLWSSAYRGLCEILGFGQGEERGSVIAGYYYCERAARAHRALLPANRSEALAAYRSIVQAQALSVVHLGRPVREHPEPAAGPVPRDEEDLLLSSARLSDARLQAGLSCDAGEFHPSGEPREDGRWGRHVSRGYAQAARLLREARRLDDMDVDLSCTHAKFADALGQPQPMDDLLGSSAGLVRLCTQMSERARRAETGDPEERAARPALYAAALRACAAALQRDPADPRAAQHIALNYRAQSVQRALHDEPICWAHDPAAKLPHVPWLAEASLSLMHAIAVRRYPQRPASVALTTALGGALLTDGRHDEAIAKLALPPTEKPGMSSSELYGILSEAHLCAEYRRCAHQSCNDAPQHGEALFEKLRAYEQNREDKPFTTEAKLQAEAMRARCVDHGARSPGHSLGYFAAAAPR